MEWLDYLRFLAALGVVLGLIVVLAWAARRFKLVPGLETGSRGGKRRLAVLEVLALDPRHRLVLVRRDAAEHLLLLGPAGHAVVESRAGPADPAAAEGPA